MNMGVYPVTDFNPPNSVDYGDVPTDNAFSGATDGAGLIVTLTPGQGAFLMCNQQMPVEGLTKTLGFRQSHKR